LSKANGTKPEVKIEPFKVVCHVVGCIKDDKGNIVQEVIINADDRGTPLQMTLYASQFGELGERVSALMAEAAPLEV